MHKKIALHPHPLCKSPIDLQNYKTLAVYPNITFRKLTFTDYNVIILRFPEAKNADIIMSKCQFAKSECWGCVMNESTYVIKLENVRNNNAELIETIKSTNEFLH